MRWLPKGTHDWDDFVTPEELRDLVTSHRDLNPEQREVAVSLQLLQGITLHAGVHEAVLHQRHR